MSGADPPDTNVTPFPVRPKDPAQKPLTIVYSYAGCQHTRAVVDEKLNELECADCHQKLNPIQFLVTMANQLTRWDEEARTIKKARELLAERKRCRCLNCGDWTDIKAVSNWELERIRQRNGKTL